MHVDSCNKLKYIRMIQKHSFPKLERKSERIIPSDQSKGLGENI